MEEFIHPLEVRLALNDIDLSKLVEGATVLDAGCGGGRGSLLMARLGAGFVDAVDVSAQNVESTRMVLQRGGAKDFEVREGSLEGLPFEDDKFDFVWCNGVLMHTALPSATLAEIVRVMRPGGSAWIYVYGSGGSYWRLMATFRQVFADVAPSRIIEILQGADVPTGRVAEMLDDWKAPFLRAYTDRVFSTALEELGCSSQRLLRGMPYDTSEQLFAGVPSEFIGEGDLRYLVTKSEFDQPRVMSENTAAELNGSHLVEGDQSRISSDATLEARVTEALELFAQKYKTNPEHGIVQAARTQLLLRDLFLPEPSAEILTEVLRELSSNS